MAPKRTWTAAEIDAMRRSLRMRPDWRDIILSTPRHKLPFRLEAYAIAHINTQLAEDAEATSQPKPRANAKPPRRRPRGGTGGGA